VIEACATIPLGDGGGSGSGSDSGSGSASIAFDAQSAASATNATSLTWTHAVGSNLSEALLIVGVSLEKQSGATVTAITFAGLAMKKAGASVGGNGVGAELWYLVAPPAGTNAVVATLSAQVGTDGVVAGAISLAGVDQTTPIRTTAISGAISGSPSTPIPVAVPGAWLVDVVVIDNGSTTSPAPAQQMRWSRLQGIGGAGSTLATPSTGTATMSWSTTSDNWAQVVVEIAP